MKFIIFIILIIITSILNPISINNIKKINKRIKIKKDSIQNIKHIQIENEKNLKEKKYYKKNVMTSCEMKFYKIFKELENEFNIVIQPQINLATIINKIGNHYQNELYRNIDFGIFTADNRKLILLIEINDKTHRQKNRRERDYKVEQICEEAEIQLIKFYPENIKDKNYIYNRIKKILTDNNL